MSDPSRPELLGPPEAPAVQHDAKTEDLLLIGLDRYFAGDYHQAINVWTRVLFLDRGHARARAYIERARSALAEQQRESEELLHSGVAALDRGDIELARRLLTSSVDRGGPEELALPILARLNRLEAAVSAVESAQRPVATRPPPARALAARPARSGWRALLLITVLGAAAIGVYLVRDQVDLRSLSPGVSSEAIISIQPLDERLPLAQPGEISLRRARRLFTTGHPVDALRMLELIRSSDPFRADADQLRAEIQRELLQYVPSRAESRTPSGLSTVTRSVGPGR
jgi:hypothetical protein